MMFLVIQICHNLKNLYLFFFLKTLFQIFTELASEMNNREKYCLQSVQDLILRDVRACDVEDYLFETSVLTLDDLTSLEEEKNPKVPENVP